MVQFPFVTVIAPCTAAPSWASRILDSSSCCRGCLFPRDLRCGRTWCTRTCLIRTPIRCPCPQPPRLGPLPRPSSDGHLQEACPERPVLGPRSSVQSGPVYVLAPAGRTRCRPTSAARFSPSATALMALEPPHRLHPVPSPLRSSLHISDYLVCDVRERLRCAVVPCGERLAVIAAPGDLKAQRQGP